MAASAQKKKLIAGVWTAAGSIAGVVAYRRLRDFEGQTPCVRESLRALEASEAAKATLGDGPLKIGLWPRQGYVDKSAGLVRASFTARSDAGGSLQVFMGGCREARFQQAWEEKDDEEPEEDGWKYYWLRPWEMKKTIADKVSSWRNSFRANADGAEKPEDEMEGWQVDTLVIMPRGADASEAQVLMGDPYKLPEYEAFCLRRDAGTKDERSRWRLRVLLGFATAGLLLTGGKRIIKSIRVSRSYGLVRRAVLADRDVNTLLGSDVAVQSSSGTFTSSYINARLRLVSQAGSVADVDVAATRSHASQPWQIAMARMRFGGSNYNLSLAVAE